MVFVVFTELPRGTFRAVVNGREADVWPVGGGCWRWNVLDREAGYLGGGKVATKDDALRAAVGCANGGAA